MWTIATLALCIHLGTIQCVEFKTVKQELYQTKTGCEIAANHKVAGIIKQVQKTLKMKKPPIYNSTITCKKTK